MARSSKPQPLILRRPRTCIRGRNSQILVFAADALAYVIASIFSSGKHGRAAPNATTAKYLIAAIAVTLSPDMAATATAAIPIKKAKVATLTR
jgi:hypothetical protein